MADKDSEMVIQRYSDTIGDAILRDKVRGIDPGAHTGFRTAALARDGMQERWLEAWRDEDSPLWTVAEYERLIDPANGKSAMTSKKTKMRATCFFDALHYCGKFESGERGNGAYDSGTSHPQRDAKPHYAAVAVDRGQPLDMDGLPLASAGGEILADGDFEDEARAIAAKTKSMALAPVVSKTA